jgi:chromate transporter
MSDSTVAPREKAASVVHPTLGEVFRAFAGVSLSGFGAPMPWARRMIVENKRWMTTEEFNETFALSQFLPGPNMVNFSVVFGARFGGAPGAVVALSGFLGPPFIVTSVLAMLYARYGDMPVLGRILSGITASAAGLLIASVAKMLVPLFKRVDWRPLVALLAFASVAIMRWPLPYVFIALAPLGIALAWRQTPAAK